MDQAMKDRGLTGEAGGRIGRTRGERGYVIPMVGLLLIPLMVVTAFAVDVGTFYAKGTDLQRAVDMAAMAGVVWLPNTSKAQTEAQDTLLKNGYSSSNATITYSQPAANRYRVQATITAPRYFSSVVTGANQTITRASTAEYNKPVPLGSPENIFGNNMPGDVNGDGDLNDAGECGNPQGACAGTQPKLWGAINSPSYGGAQGDPFATLCPTGTSCGWPNPATNAEYRPDGYLYAIAATAGQTVTVQIYDASVVSSSTLTGDSGSFPVDYELFTEDGSDLTYSTDASLTMSTGGRCSSGPGRRAFPGGYNNLSGFGRLQNRWWTLCTFTAPTTGIYPLRVKTSNIPADGVTGVTACTGATYCTKTTGGTGATNASGGMNAYSLRATVASGTQPRIYGLEDMSIYTPTNAATATFYLAEVAEIHAGKKLVLDLYDPGDLNGIGTMEINGPNGADYPCTVRSGGNSDGRGTVTTTNSTLNGTECRFYTANNGSLFNDKWLRVEINIPTSYTCPTTGDKCWWKVNYNTTSSSTDRTTWALQIVGDPVHLTE